MKRAIRRWLGLDHLQQDLSVLLLTLNDVIVEQRKLKKDITTFNMLAARVVAAIDPRFAMDPQDPRMKEQSDYIAEKVIKRIQGEYAAMQNMAGR